MTDFRNLAQLSSDALLVVARGCIAYANPAALALMAPAGDPPDLQGMTVQALWQPNPLDGAWAGPEPLAPAVVQLQTGHPQDSLISLELTATRTLTPEGPVFYVRACRVLAQGGDLAERVRTALALSTDAAMVVDAQTLQFLDANPAACALMGMTLAAVRERGPTHLRRRDGTGQEDFHALYAQLIERAPQAQTHEYDFMAPDGRTLPIAATRQALNLDGRWLIFITWRDLSAQVAAQALVQQFKDAFDQTPDATNIIDVQTLSYVYVNEPFVRLMRLPRERILAGGPLSMPREIVVVDNLAAFLASVVARHPDTLVQEKTATLPDGRQATFESYHQAIFSGGRWLVRATRVDITQRKEQQRHLQLILAAFDASSDGIYIIDPQTFSYVDVNEAAARLHGMSRDELRALGVRGAFAGRFDDAALRARYDDLIARYPQSLTEDRQIPRADGKVVWAESIRRAIVVDGQWRVISVMRDITERRRAQERLAQFKAAFDQSSDAVAIVDIEAMTYVYNNDANLRLLGIAREELDRLGPQEVADRLGGKGDQRAFFAELVAQYPEPVNREFAYRRADASLGHYSIRHQAMRSDSGWLAISTKVDITQRKQAQLQLELLLAAMDAAPDAIAVLDPASFQYVHVNEAVCRLHGRTRDEVMALGMLGMFAHFTPGALRQRYDDLIAMAPQAVSEERRVRRPDGSEVATEAVRRAVRVGERWLVISVSRDVTERKAAQVRIGRFAAIVNLSADALFVVDRESMQIVDVNDATTRMYGYTRDALLGRPVNALTATYRDEAQRMAVEYDEVIAQSPRVSVLEMVPQRADGSTFQAEVQRMAIQSEGRWLVVITVRDISARKAAQARLELMNQAMDAAPDAIVAIDPETLEYIAVNEAATRMTGNTREDMYARGPTASFSGTFDPQGLRQTYADVIAQAPRTVTEERSVARADRDGNHAILEFTRRAVQIDGRWVIVSVNRDITERKTREAHVEMLRAAIDLAPDAFFLIDPQALQYVDVNRAAGAMYGLSREQVLAMGLLGYVRHVGLYGHDEAPARLQEDYAAVIARYPQAQVLERAVRLPGRELVYNENVRKAVALDGRWLIVSVTRDITERKRQQARMERFAAVLNLSADAVLLVDRASVRIIDVNEAACRMYGYTRDAMLALAPHEGRGDTTRERLLADYDEAIRQSPGVVHAEITARRADGSTFIAEVQRQALRPSSGDGWIIAVIARDITQRKAAEAGLQQLKAVVDVAPDGMYIIDPHAQEYITLNHAAGQLYGLTREQVLHMGMTGFMRWLGSFDASLKPESVRERHFWLIDHYPQIHTSERLVRLPGRADIVTETLRQAVQVDGRWLILVVVRDITQRKRAEDEIRARMAELTRSNQELEQFAYVTSHDLSEPLRMVASYTQLLSRRYADKFDDDGREFIKYAVDGAQRMKQLIDDLLMYSRAGRAKVAMRHMRLDRSLDDALANLAHAIERTGATIERGPLPELVCEKAGLTQVFQNLVGNAIKFRGDAAPVVRISAVQDEHFWTISVADNGIGISSEYFQRIFIIFQRLHARTRYEGTGIGLSICKKIVERHGGQITVASEPGQGTTFSFTLSKTLTESESP